MIATFVASALGFGTKKNKTKQVKRYRQKDRKYF